MNPSVSCFPQPGKAKSRDVLAAFARGAGGVVSTATALPPVGAVAFFGVMGIEHLFRQAVSEKRVFFYGDNAYLDRQRGTHYRFGRSAVQSLYRPDFDRARAMGIEVRPWRTSGRTIVVVEQSAHFYRHVAGITSDWLDVTLATLAKFTDRPLVVRRWRQDKNKALKTLPLDLKDAWALVTHSSAAANEALLAGVPVFVSGSCAAAPLASGELSGVESPARVDGREAWAASIAASQWTLEELAAGVAWRKMRGEGP